MDLMIVQHQERIKIYLHLLRFIYGFLHAKVIIFNTVIDDPRIEHRGIFVDIRPILHGGIVILLLEILPVQGVVLDGLHTVRTVFFA